MRSNNQQIRQIRKVIEKISQMKMLKTTKSIVSLGIEGRQWLACAMICAMLLPVFALPVGASFRYSGNENNAQFEPVNEKLPVWTETWRNLNAKIEAWATPLRAENAFYEGEDDKKKKGKEEKDTKETEKPQEIVKTSAETSISNSAEKTEVKAETHPTESDTSKPNSENKNTGNVHTNNAAVAANVLNQLPDNERDSVYNYQNNLGAPAGQTEADSSNQAAALRIRHRAGIANFSFGIPLASLSGRGIDAGVGLTYNSRTWNKSLITDPNNPNATVNHFTYDVEQSWIAPGFSSGLGYLQSNFVTRSVVMMNGSNTVNRTLTEIIPEGITDSDGTRHQIQCKTFSQIPGGHSSSLYCTAFETIDGSFIRVKRNGSVYSIGVTVNYADTNFTITYPNGSKVYDSNPFGSGNSRKHYPLVIQDGNGNRIRIAYKADQSGRIDFITDTLNRKIKFYYETDATGNPDKLVAVTIPGMNGTDEIQTVRFYYAEMPLQTGGFISTAQVTAPATIRVLKYVYMPATNTGYKYDYHSYYGMIKKITRLVGMTASTTGILTEGTFAASTEYDYPDGTTPQTDVPKYTKRTDDWQGRTAAAPPETLYHVPEDLGETVSIITAKDNGFDVETKTVSLPGGLLQETTVSERTGPEDPVTRERPFSKLMSKAEYTWAGSRNLTRLITTNEAGLVKKTEFEYDNYNNQKIVREYDYGTTTPSLLRTTEIKYEIGAGWINNNLLSLPTSVKTIVGSVTVSKTLYEYDHGGDDSTLTKYSDIINYDPTYNPLNPPRTCTRVCDPDEIPAGYTKVGEDEEENNVICATYCTGSYISSTKYRGNVTKVTGFSDATLTTDTNADVNNYEYDIAGNLVSATLSCCQLKIFEYGENFAETGYAYPVKEIKGTSPTQLINSVTYNRNTGLVLTSTDENAQVTNYEYETDTLRPKKTIYPNGGYVQTEYSDKLAPGTLPGFVRKTTTLDSTHTAQSYSYFNGLGLGIRSATQTPDDWSVSAVEYDKLGRPLISYNPFYVSTPTGVIPSGTKFTEVLNYDALGRTTSVRLQDNTTVSTEFSDTNTTPSGFNKTFMTVTDQAGKKRRQVVDSLGRIARVDEPDVNGILGDVTTPNQPTNYEYDSNDNLAKVTQSDGTVTQERLFKYDSLSRLTHERQVEAIPTLDLDGVKGTADPNKWTKVLKYNTEGLLTEGIDSRGVKTTFTYDGLNRASSVVFTGETGYQTPTINYTFDQERSGFYNKGRLTKVTTLAVAGTQETPATEQVYDFDKMGQVVKHQQKIDGQSYLLEYGYNLASQLTNEKYPSGKIVNVGYDANGRLSSVSDVQRTYLNGITFNSRTLPTQMNFGNGTNQTFAFNDRLQMTNQTLSRGAEVLQKYDYGFGQIDANGNLDTTKNNGQLAKIESHIGTAKQWTQRFKYDSIGRLSEAEEKRGDTNALTYKQKFDFDRFGSLYRKNASNPTTGQENPLSFAPIENADIDRSTNRFTSATGTMYNEAGQVVSDNKFRLMNFSYDANGRMVKATKTNVPDALSVYDALGHRVATKVNDIWQFVIYDAFGRLVAEYGGQTSSDEGGVRYILQDWQGSVKAVLSNSGFVQSRTDYQAFGEEINSGIGLRTAIQGFGGDANTKQGYGLTEQDDASRLKHTWFRKLESQAGRWTSPDPYSASSTIGNPQSWNKFAYVQNQPTNAVDPTGLLQLWCQWFANFYYPNGVNDPTGRTQIGNSWLQCWAIPDGNAQPGANDPQIQFPDGGGTTLRWEQQDKEKADKFLKCVQKKVGRIQRDLNQTLNGDGGIWDTAGKQIAAALILGAILIIGEVVVALVTFGFLAPEMLALMAITVVIDLVAIGVIYSIAQGQANSAIGIAQSQTNDAFEDCAKDEGVTTGQAPPPLPISGAN